MYFYDPNEFIKESDSASIQAAIDEASRTGCNRVVIPAFNKRTGQYLWVIDTTILLPSHMELVLDGAHLRMADGVMCQMLRNSNAMTDLCKRPEGVQEGIVIRGVGNATLDGGRHNGLREDNSGKDGMPLVYNNLTVYLHQVKDFRIQGLHITDQRWWAIACAFCWDGVIEDLHFAITDLTQEEVATQLGISPQSISKWERGDGYPDITMLPALANYFRITVDELIGMDKINDANTLDTINQTWAENRKNQKHSDNIALMKEALKTYPNHPRLLVQLSASLERLDGTDAQRHENLRESIAVQEQILQYCDDCEVRAATLFNISDAYYRYGDYEKALAYADKLPNLYKTRESALVRILTDPQEKNRIAKSALEPLLWQLTLHLTTLAETEQDDRYIEKLSQIREILN